MVKTGRGSIVQHTGTTAVSCQNTVTQQSCCPKASIQGRHPSVLHLLWMAACNDTAEASNKAQ